MKTAAALALAAVGVGCGNKTGGDIKPEGSAGPAGGPAMTEWRVGAYLSLSGENTAFGTDTREGIELAVTEINKAGGR
jgi:branched-chain amino acid transport system substrate-binding protein